jgi:hypothetical protein
MAPNMPNMPLFSGFQVWPVPNYREKPRTLDSGRSIFRNFRNNPRNFTLHCRRPPVVAVSSLCNERNTNQGATTMTQQETQLTASSIQTSIQAAIDLIGGMVMDSSMDDAQRYEALSALQSAHAEADLLHA